MPSAPPDGDPAPPDGLLPQSVLTGAGERAWRAYLHVPYCRVRCGYCDFNTYTAAELGPGADQADYPDTVLAEVDLARRVLAEAGLPERPLSSVFIGGGTPTLLRASALGKLLAGLQWSWGLAPGAEVTTEANPDSVDADYLEDLAFSGFTRVSFGMQSAVPHVLATLDRTHDPARVPVVVAAARAAGLAVSLDLIYGTPGESLADWRATLEAALACAPDHISAYALVVEPGTKLAARVRRGEVALPVDDDLAEKYELAEELLAAAGYSWYEVSNWARTPSDACAHNLGYWRGDDWWGFGPGAHSHVGGVRWWNVRHPRAYAAALAAGRSPAEGRECLSESQIRDEKVLLGVRLVEGLPVTDAPDAAPAALAGLVADGLIDGRALLGGRITLTVRGRLLADRVVHTLLT